MTGFSSGFAEGFGPPPAQVGRFLGIAVQTDIIVVSAIGTAPTRVTFFRPEDLLACVAIRSPTEPESLTVHVPRDDARAVEITMGRVLRVVTESATDDSEWDIATLDDASTDNVLVVTALPIAMRLARVVYMGTTATTGAADPTWTGVELTATEWLAALVTPPLATAGMAFTVGTVDNTTTRFTMNGEWSSILEIVNAICEPGRANAEFQLRMGGNYGYVIDLLDVIGSSAATVRVRTAVNLIETKRDRSLIEVATRLFPRGATASVATRTMEDNLWRIASVVNGTTLALEPIWGGDNPILYDDQLNGMYVAPLVFGTETFASHVVTDSVASTQRITVTNTATFTAGDWCRFFMATGASGARVTSLTHPTLIDHPSDGGYGDRGQVLDRPGIIADTNLIRNAMMRTWTVAADPPDDWTEFADDTTDVTFTQELADGPTDGVPAFRLATAIGGYITYGAYVGGTNVNAIQGPGVCASSPAAQPWNTASRTHVATGWIKVVSAPTSGKINLYLHDADRSGAPKWLVAQDAGPIGTWTEGTDPEGVWIRYESAGLDLSGQNPGGTSAAMTGRLRVRYELGTTLGVGVTTNPVGTWQGRWNIATGYVQYDYVSYVNNVYYCSVATSTGVTPPGGDWTVIGAPNRRADQGWDVLVAAATLAESPTAIADREGSGGTELWQAVNAVLPTRVTPVKGYDLTVADLAADDSTTYATLAFTPGGTVEVTDSDLSVVTSLRLMEYARDYLRPMDSRLRVGQLADVLTKLLESGRSLTTLGR